jgi:hypothetical protein
MLYSSQSALTIFFLFKYISYCTTMRTLTPLYHHIDKEVSPLFSFNLLIIPSSTIQYNLVIALATTTALLMIFRLRHNPSGLIIVSHRNRFVILRTDNSLPITPHPALRQRSYFQLQSLWFTLERTYTLLVECLRGRTRSECPHSDTPYRDVITTPTNTTNL